MILVFAPLLSLVAIVAGGLATAIAILLNGPRRLKHRGEPPLVVMPPVETPAMRSERERSAV